MDAQRSKAVLETINRIRHTVPKLPDPQWFHVFFIYKTISPDKDIVEKLVQNLEVLGYKCGTHQNDFVLGKFITENVFNCLQKTLTLVILLSKEFCRSDWCKYDLQMAQTLKNNGQKLHIIPLVLDNCDIPDTIGHVTYLEIDDKSIDAWHGRFLKSIYESINLDDQITRSSSSSSICRYCERYIEVNSNTENLSQEEDIQFPFDEDDTMKSKNKLAQDTERKYNFDTYPHVPYPEFALLQKRLSSFDKSDWTSKRLPDPRIMAVNGFFLTDNKTSVRCFQCGIGLKDWSPDDDPVFEHARWSPKCQYILAKEGKNYIDLVAEAVREVQMLDVKQRLKLRLLDDTRSLKLNTPFTDLNQSGKEFGMSRIDSGLSSVFGSRSSLVGSTESLSEFLSTNTVRMSSSLKDDDCLFM